jgi:hypothetical protein
VKKLAYREIHITIPLYKTGVIVLLSKDIPKCVSKIKKWFEGEYTEWDFASSHGKTIYRDGYNGVVIWLPQFPKTPYELSCAFHEIFHTVIRIMANRDIVLSNSSEEAFTYLAEYIAFKLLYANHKRKRTSAKK